MTLQQALLGFAVLCVVLTIIPGLDTTLVLRSALVQGRGHAIATAAGISVGVLAWGCAAAVGAAALLTASHAAYLAVTVGGAAYMVYLGARMIIRSFRDRTGHTIDLARPPGAWWHAMGTGAWTNLLNPKIGVFYIATLPQFLPAGSPALGTGLLLAGVHVTIGAAWFTALIAAATAARRWLTRPRSIRVIDRCAGVALVAFGTRLAVQYR